MWCFKQCCGSKIIFSDPSLALISDSYPATAPISDLDWGFRLYIEKYIGVYLILPQGWKNSPPIFELQCSTRNVSNVLTEDQCKWLSTKWFIPLKERTQWLHNEYYESLLLYYSTIDSNNFLTQLAADPPSSHRNGFSPTCLHVFPISAWFQLTLFLGVRRAGHLNPFYL